MQTEPKTHENGLKSTSACSCMVFLLSFHGLCEHMCIEEIKLVLAKQSKQAKEVSIIRSLFFMPRFYIKSQKQDLSQNMQVVHECKMASSIKTKLCNTSLPLYCFTNVRNWHLLWSIIKCQNRVEPCYNYYYTVIIIGFPS